MASHDNSRLASGGNDRVPMVRARQMFCWLVRKYTAKSFPETGRMLGGRDHSTILHAVQKINSKLPDYLDDIRAICAVLEVPAP